MRFALSLSLALLAAVASLTPTFAFAQDQVSVSRYTLVTPAPQPDQMNPLKTVVSIEFPRGNVKTVGDAAEHLLARSGYRLDQFNTEGGALIGHARLVGFPLPEVHRHFDTVPIEQILVALAAPSYEPRIDHVNRKVSFALHNERALQPSAVQKPEVEEELESQARLPGSRPGSKRELN